MIAKLLRLLRALLVVAALGALLMAVTQGSLKWLWLWFVPVMLLVAVFALQGFWLHWRNRADPAPRASFLAVARALIDEARISLPLFLGHMAQVGPEPLAHLDVRRHRGQTAVLLIHGYCCNAGFWPLWRQRLTQADVPHVALTLEPALGSIDKMVSVVDAEVMRLVEATGRPVVLCGHSMGGLVIRAWWRASGVAADSRVERVITIGTPHLGTATARFAHTPNGRQMREGAPWLAELCADEPPNRAASATCFYSHCDNIVFPASSAAWPGADNRHLPGKAHIALIEHPDCWAELMRWVRPSRHGLS